MPKIVTQEIATARKDIDIFIGWATRLENPDPVLLSKGAGKGLKLYDEVMRDAHAASVLQTRILAVTGREWEIIPPDAAGAGSSKTRPGKMDDICAFLKQTLLDVNFDQARQEMLKAIVYGFYPAEVIWKTTGSAWMIDKIIAKHPRRFVFTPERELRLLTPGNMIDGEIVPERKFICFTWGSSDNPYGSGLGQILWWPVWFKKHGIKFWMVFLEKFGMPTVAGKYPPGTDNATQTKLLDVIESLQTETGVIVPDTMQLELMEASRTGQASYQGLCDYMDRAISKTVLSQTLTTEVKGEGSFAASKTHDEVRMEIVKSDADCLCETLNKTLIQWLVVLNFGPQAEYPKIWIRTEEESDLKPLAERDKLLFDMGVEFPRSYFYETYGIPEPEAGEETVQSSGQSSETDENGTKQIKPGQNDKNKKKAEAGARKTGGAFGEAAAGLFPDQTAIDAVRPPDGQTFAPMLKPVIELIQNGHSYQEVEETLMSTWPEMDAGEMEKLMERAIFASEIWGRLHA